MKTLRFVSAIALFALFCVLPAAAQTATKENSSQGDSKADYYYVNVRVEKVYPYRMGYLVLYRKSGADLGQMYLPMKWFSQSAGKGELVTLPFGPDWPYVSVYYKNGAFSHVRLFVARSYSHQTWGNIPQSTNLDDKFNVDDLKVEY